MGLYNTVTVKRLTSCPRCGHDGDIQVQFAYGDTYLRHYVLGDAIGWGGNDVGVPAPGAIESLAFPEPCPICGLETQEEYALSGDPGQQVAEYVLTIQDGRITGYRQATAADVRRLESGTAGDRPLASPDDHADR
jgi:hypothetical protein